MDRKSSWERIARDGAQHEMAYGKRVHTARGGIWHEMACDKMRHTARESIRHEVAYSKQDHRASSWSGKSSRHAWPYVMAQDI